MKTDEHLSLTEISALRIQAEQLLSSTSSAQVLESRNAGWASSNAIGSGMDYAESRAYQQGDDPRNINWRLSARSTETYVKTYHMDSRPSMCIVLDQRRSMLFGTRVRLKATQALRLVTLLMFAAEQHGIELQIMTIGETIQWFEKGAVQTHLAETNHLVPPTHAQNIAEQVPFSEALLGLNQRLSKGTLLYLISDLMDIQVDDQKQLAQLQSEHFVQALHIVDPAEEKLPKSGGVSLQDIMSNTSFFLKAGDESSHKSLHIALNNHLTHIKKVCTQSAVQYSKVKSHDERLDPHIIFPLGLA